ncbi:sulfur oxidation c-type cytochrome SoxA [Paracoccus sp. S-4012]|uniref:sulfur oxidation c-type cytochrome SoxA n=1 Tax=Paracoccus sp. S-4012 TaxID=2665648 RepID=UPI0012B04BDE|nr:sulfur oxidation c-type cytochrome SoxA [Paracoccus sp. S-4012]MRX48947.1 sulfur oxidation c-type cytochrome SoxA [Paracoccus sp. S-4012]
MIRHAALLALMATAAQAEAPVSGYAFMQPETQALQDDAFANPGMLWVDLGRELWNRPEASGDSCAGCHGGPETLRGVGARYPAWSATEGRVVSLEQQINLCREGRQQAVPLPYGSRELLALSALVMHQSLGLPQAVATDGPAAEAYVRGRDYFETRRGQLNLSCANCHVEQAGSRLRGETISQGQVNGFPIYRQLWQDIGSAGRMIAWCNEAVRATQLEEGSPMAVELELYLRARGNGLAIESPAVRR